MTQPSATPNDPQDMLGIVESSADLWADAVAIAAASEVVVPSPARAVLVLGMGGSGIAADLARLATDTAGTTPVVPVKGYQLPAWAGADTPAVAVSHSGNTEETLAAVTAAQQADCPLVAVTSGGQLAKLADAAGAATVRIPGGMQPRASLAYLAAPVLMALERGGHASGVAAALAAVPDHLRAARAGWGDEPAKVAAALLDRVPVFVGGNGVGATVALRARCQVNENAERPALDVTLPEADHNAIVGWGGGPDVAFGVVEVRDAEDHPRIGLRFGATQDLIASHAPLVHSLELAGPSRLVRLAAGILWVDLVSVHLALLAGVDPTPVDRIAALKQRLADA